MAYLNRLFSSTKMDANQRKAKITKAVETVICTHTGSKDVRIQPKSLQKVLRERGFNVRILDDIVLRKEHHLIFKPGSSKREIEAAKQCKSGKEDVLRRLSRLRQPTLVQRPVENESRNRPSEHEKEKQE